MKHLEFCVLKKLNNGDKGAEIAFVENLGDDSVIVRHRAEIMADDARAIAEFLRSNRERYTYSTDDLTLRFTRYAAGVSMEFGITHDQLFEVLGGYFAKTLDIPNATKDWDEIAEFADNYPTDQTPS